MTITAIKVNGTALDLADVEVTLGINHGRNDIASGSQPSDASLTLRNFATIPAQIGDELTIEAWVNLDEIRDKRAQEKKG